MPTKKRKKKVKAADLSKRSIGVGSMCIDDTTLINDGSKTFGSGSGSMASKSKQSKQKKNQMTEQAKEFIKKRYLSSEEENRTKEQVDVVG